MNKVSIALFLLGIFTGIGQKKENMLLGKISVSELREPPYSDWFVQGYKNYGVDTTHIKDLNTLLEGVSITIFMGTWCSDSQRNVPHFYKILKAAEFPLNNIEMIAVDREKTTPNHLEKGFDIIRVPTFIFSRDGGELGRIVEYPIQSLEADMSRILSGEFYQPAYTN